MVMEVNGKQLPIEIDETGNKHRQPPMAIDGDVGTFQTLINQIDG
jgi:hypothetical protein